MVKDILDITLIEQILQGDRQAFRYLYDRYKKSLLLICLRYMKYRPDAEDLLQDSFIKIYKALNTYDRERGEFYTWSKRIVINSCLEHLRKKKFKLDFDQILDMVDPVRINAEAIENLNLQDLTDLILKLPKGYRTVFNLYVVDGYKHREIGELLGINENTSKTQLMKARKMLQELIKEQKPVRFGHYA